MEVAGEATMKHCTVEDINAPFGIFQGMNGRLHMFDTVVRRVSGDRWTAGIGLLIKNDAELTRCTVEAIAGTAISVWHRRPKSQLVLTDCILRANHHDGIVARRGCVSMRGMTEVTHNLENGVVVAAEATVSVLDSSHSCVNGQHDWAQHRKQSFVSD